MSDSDRPASKARDARALVTSAATSDNGAADAASPRVEPGEDTTPKDVVYVHGQTEHGLGIARLRNDAIELGELRPLKEGQPIAGDIVKLSQRKESERLFDVEVVHEHKPAPSKTASTSASSASAPPRKGPPKVTSDAFRAHWDEVFGVKKKRKPDPMPS